MNWQRTFSFIWAGQFISLLTTSIAGYAVILWLSVETKSAAVLAAATIASILPQAVLGIFSGVFVDRWNRKRTMIIADSSVAFFTLILCALFYSGIVDRRFLYIILSFRSAASAFHMPAMQAAVPLLAPESELLRIAGVNQTIQSVCIIAAPALAALLIGVTEIYNVLLLDVAGALFACTSLLFIHIPDPAKKTAEPPRIFKALREGYREVAKHRGLRLLFLFSIIFMFGVVPLGALFPLMTLEIFHGGIFQVSLVETVWGGGMLIGGTLLSLKKVGFNRIILINTMYIILGGGFFISGLLPASGFIFFLILSGTGGVAGTIYHASFTAVIQQVIDPSVLGRVFSIFTSINLLPAVIGLLFTGFFSDIVGLSATFIFTGGVFIFIGAISFFIPALNALKKQL